ncbi:MAG: hypothetical protein ACE3JQ_08140 [Paenisporosarcina sp.]
MDLIEFIQVTKSKSDHEIAKMTKDLPVELTKDEIKKLRPLLDKASFHWVFTGVPSTFKKEIATIIGKSRAKTLFNFFNI